MKSQIRPPWALVMMSVLALAGTSAARDPEGVFEQTLPVSAPVEVDVTTNSGNIVVRPGDGASVHVRGVVRVERGVNAQDAARKIQEIVNHPPIEQSGSHIRIGPIKDWKIGSLVSVSLDRHQISISYELTVPADTRLTSETGSGDMVVASLKGPVRATTGSGNVKLSNLSSGVRAGAGSGNIEMTSVAGMVDADTGSGNIVATGISGATRIHAGSGNVSLEQATQDSVEVETGSGDVQIRGAHGVLRAKTGSGNITALGQPGGDWKLETGSGDVTLKLLAPASFELNAHTGSGSIESKLAITVRGKMNRSELRGTVGAGGALVSVGTGSGDIRIE